MTVTEIKTRAEFDALISSTPYVALQASASWCGPCKAISPFYAKHASSLAVPERVAFAKFDTDDIPDLAADLGIRSIPAFFTFESGDKTDTLAGANPAALKKLVDGLAAKGAPPSEPAASAPASEAAEEKKEPAV
ncbi:thioredoxin-like protein [Stachybotrys elegans]|uniref:Thioredoxin-like protein n=1 Tax=Stachybotrys elegans TaxID=80388 RepID=A0A8K0WKE4_9HYPO|nr:thioredoxin-like protein [Stachybotrys elegans]